jgi:acetylornithine deacetylase/succinyl-diaminopimelate desuccinylase-like protein
MADDAVKTEYTFELPKGYVDEKGQVHREVTLREITGADQEAMLNPQLRNNPAKMLTALLARVITKLGTLEGRQVDAGVTANMFKSDRDFLILKLKEIDSGPEMDIDVECPDCGKKFKAMLDISDFFGK